MADQARKDLSPCFAVPQATRPLIVPGKLLRALLPQVLYTVGARGSKRSSWTTAFCTAGWWDSTSTSPYVGAPGRFGLLTTA
jgi:hypothetical protein